MYGKQALPDVCRAIRSIGYTGIEIAPFTLCDSPLDLSPAVRREYRSVIAGEGLSFVGLHWLLASPAGLHVTAPDRGLRERSWQHVRHLIDLCADLGDGGIMVFGSPKQRSTAGIGIAEASRNYIEGLASVAPHADSRRVTILVEALPRNQSDVINTLAEAAAIVNEINSPAVRTMFDTHNTADESEPHGAIVDRYFDLIRHVHINEMDGRHPGTGSYEFKPILETLRRRSYTGWLSLEVFDFTLGAGQIATESLRFMEKEIAELSA